MKRLALALSLFAPTLRAAVPNVASSSTITLHGSGIYRITGTTTIDTIDGLRDGDEVFLLPAAAFGLSALGNINPVTTTATVDRPIHLEKANGIIYEVGPSVSGGGGGGAPTTAKYIVQQADATLTAEQAMGALGTGIVKSTTVTGVQSIAVAGDFPVLNQNTTGTAAALTADPADCAANRYATAINASGTLTCAQVDLTAGVTGTLPFGNGGTGLSSAADDTVMVSSGAAWQAKAVPNCTIATQKLLYDTATNTWSCQPDADTSGAPTTATYITQTADAGLSAEQALGALATGILKSTTTTGVVSIAAAGTDYLKPDITTLYGAQFFVQSADVTNATTTPANATGLVFTYAANSVYYIDLDLMATSVATTTGYGYAFDVSTAVTFVGLQFSHALAAAGTVTGGDSVADNVARGLSSGVQTAGAVNPITGNGILVTGANTGTCQLTFRPEVAASATALAKSMIRVIKVQ